MKRLILVRHGETEQNRDYPERVITAQGRERMKETAEAIKEYLQGEIVILHSPALRTKQSAQVLSGLLRIPKIEEAPLHIQEDENIISGENRNEGIESPEELYARFLRIFSSRPEEIVIAVSHEASLDRFFKLAKDFEVIERSFFDWFGYSDYAVLDRIGA